MNFNINDFFLEADDEAKKEEEKKEKEETKDEEKDKEETKEKEEDSSEDDDNEYNDLMDDDIDTESDSEESFDKDDDSEYNDLMDDDIGDLSSDESIESDSDNGSDDYNALIVVKDTKGGGCEGGLYENIAKLGYLYTIIANNMKHIHLNSIGQKFEEIHRQSEEYYNHFMWQTDRYFELASESPMIKLDNPTRSKEHIEDIEVESDDNYTFEKAISKMSDNFNKAIEYLKSTRECAGNDRTDIQSTLDEELTYLNKQFNFILRKKMINDDTVSATNESYNWLF